MPTPKRLSDAQLRAAVLSSWKRWKAADAARQAEQARLSDRDDDTPEEIVDAINAGLLARYMRESGGR